MGSSTSSEVPEEPTMSENRNQTMPEEGRNQTMPEENRSCQVNPKPFSFEDGGLIQKDYKYEEPLFKPSRPNEGEIHETWNNPRREPPVGELQFKPFCGPHHRPGAEMKVWENEERNTSMNLGVTNEPGAFGGIKFKF